MQPKKKKKKKEERKGENDDGVYRLVWSSSASLFRSFLRRNTGKVCCDDMSRDIGTRGTHEKCSHALKNVPGSALPAYEVAFGKHRAAFQLARSFRLTRLIQIVRNSGEDENGAAARS